MSEVKVACKRAATALVLGIADTDRVAVVGPSFVVHVDGKFRRLSTRDEMSILALTSVAATLCIGSGGDADLPDDVVAQYKHVQKVFDDHLFNVAALAHGLLHEH